MLFSMKIVQFFDTFRGMSPLGMGILMDLLKEQAREIDGFHALVVIR